jgi:hypothetical protein
MEMETGMAEFSESARHLLLLLGEKAGMRAVVSSIFIVEGRKGDPEHFEKSVETSDLTPALSSEERENRRMLVEDFMPVGAVRRRDDSGDEAMAKGKRFWTEIERRNYSAAMNLDRLQNTLGIRV